jgi:adenylylsulfate kinase
MSTMPNTWRLTGLHAAGKTTLASHLCAALRQSGQAACLLDGDEVRQGLSKDLGFSLTDREENMRRVAEMARLLNNAGIHALVALVSPSIAGRLSAKQILKAQTNPGMAMTGVDSPYEVPPAPHFTTPDVSKIEIDVVVKPILYAADS